MLIKIGMPIERPAEYFLNRHVDAKGYSGEWMWRASKILKKKSPEGVQHYQVLTPLENLYSSRSSYQLVNRAEGWTDSSEQTLKHNGNVVRDTGPASTRWGEDNVGTARFFSTASCESSDECSTISNMHRSGPTSCKREWDGGCASGSH